MTTAPKALRIQFNEAVELLCEPFPWEPNGHPRRAGVSSFGATGTNDVDVQAIAEGIKNTDPAALQTVVGGNKTPRQNPCDVKHCDEISLQESCIGNVKLRILQSLNVRFGSLADIVQRQRHVRFTPDSGHAASPSKESAMCHKRTFWRLKQMPPSHWVRCTAGGFHEPSRMPSLPQ